MVRGHAHSYCCLQAHLSAAHPVAQDAPSFVLRMDATLPS